MLRAKTNHTAAYARNKRHADQKLLDADGQPPVYEIEWPEPAEVAALCCKYKPRIGETSYRCIIRDGWNVLLQPIGDYQPTRGERDCYLMQRRPATSTFPPSCCIATRSASSPSVAC